jgi:hypothetical protein
MTTNEAGNEPDDQNGGGLVREVGRTVQGSLNSWGKTLRLCVIAATAAALWSGVTAVDHMMQDDQSPTCVTTSR